MNKKKRILLIVILVLLLVIAGIVLWQWNNIDAVIQSVRYDEETIQEMMSENESQIQETLDMYPGLVVRPLDEETREKFNSGELTEEDVIEILTNPSTTEKNDGKESTSKPTESKPEQSETKPEPSKPEQSETKPEPSKPEQSETKPESSKPEQSETKPKPSKPESTETETEKPKSVSEANEEISRLVARVYVIQMDFIAKLGGIEAKARAEIAKLPEKQQTYDRKIAIGKSYVGEMSALEAQCDGEISAIVSRVRKLLTDSGQPTALADTIKSSYEREKSLKKAYYVNRYL